MLVNSQDSKTLNPCTADVLTINTLDTIAHMFSNIQIEQPMGSS